MRFRIRLTLYMTLWALVGIGLLTLPALLSPTSNRTNETPVVGNTRTPATMISSNSANPGSTPAPTESFTAEDFLLRLLLIFVPAGLFATFVKARTSKLLKKTGA